MPMESLPNDAKSEYIQLCWCQSQKCENVKSFITCQLNVYLPYMNWAYFFSGALPIKLHNDFKSMHAVGRQITDLHGRWMNVHGFLYRIIGIIKSIQAICLPPHDIFRKFNVFSLQLDWFWYYLKLMNDTNFNIQRQKWSYIWVWIHLQSHRKNVWKKMFVECKSYHISLFIVNDEEVQRTRNLIGIQYQHILSHSAFFYISSTILGLAINSRIESLKCKLLQALKGWYLLAMS